ncbi:glycoside hydrolase family 73 protein [Clostridium sp. 'White wine YQ']|uniref:glycoside hydrolase family 73 protein n=1 Tax=Clostridium sp. 'White wine YQ' TaxID=3027474 RepID=UPI00236606BF|nr:glucosaminidase domain-containing protein [Clostridium sp. 'White wine YQ']MDD7793120.1 glucosaminidase domain-containing protein [Clostridium sp. 'White wine YQ']
MGKKRMKYIVFVALLVVITIVSIVGVKKYNRYKLEENRLKNIAITKDAMKLYMNEADSVGENKIQLNWKEIAAVSAIEENNYFTKMDESKVKALAEKFVVEKKVSGKTYYGSKGIDEIIDELQYTDKEKTRVHNYYDQLQKMGLYPENYTDKNLQFIKTVEPYAYKIYEKYGILPSVVVAQSIAESGWGNYAEINNYFGIKADTSWKGPSKLITTTEYNGETIKAKFRVYDSIEASFEDYGKFLSNNVRYKQAGVFEAKNYKDMAKAIEKGGYSTHENSSGEKIYADNLISIIKANNLMILDNNAENKKFKELSN